jgi:hypothetical protein
MNPSYEAFTSLALPCQAIKITAYFRMSGRRLSTSEKQLFRGEAVRQALGHFVLRCTPHYPLPRQNVISCSTGSAGNALGDVSCQWHLETHALKRFQHQDNPQNQSKEANEVQEERAKRERTPIAAPAKPPAYAKDRTEHGLHNLQSEENDYGLRGVESHVRAPVKEEKDQACDPAQHVA